MHSKTEMEIVSSNLVMELVLFKLKEGTDSNIFVQAAAALTEVLQTGIPGFKGRTLLHTTDKTQWTDMIYWTDMEMAMAAMKQINSLPAFQTFVSMIDSQGITLLHLIPADLGA